MTENNRICPAKRTLIEIRMSIVARAVVVNMPVIENKKLRGGRNRRKETSTSTIHRAGPAIVSFVLLFRELLRICNFSIVIFSIILFVIFSIFQSILYSVLFSSFVNAITIIVE